MGKLTTARRAVDEISDGATVAILGAGGGILEPDLLLQTLADRYRETGSPRGLTLVHSAGLGDRATRGLTALADAGLVRRAIGGHWGQSPAMSRLAEQEAIEAYNLPLGVLSLLLREIAGGRPGLVTKIGLGTFVDPRLDGGKLNERTTEDLVELIELAGEQWLFYKALHIDVAFVRSSVGDENGNLSFLHEPSYLDAYAVAAATRACGGTVIAQVGKVVERGGLLPKEVHVPAPVVHRIVLHDAQWQTYDGETNAAFAGTERVRFADREPMPFNQRKVIARRAAVELRRGDVINLGVGIPDGVASVLAEEDVVDEVTFTVEHGIFGGITARGHVFGASVNHDSVVPMPDMIDFYHSGGHDIAFLGFAQADRFGNVNVSKFGGTVMGTGGFIDITQPCKTVVFCGSFKARGTDIDYEDGIARVVRHGDVPKLVDHVDQITFSGEEALKRGQRVLVVTERCVFELLEQGLTLIEVAAGIDAPEDIIAHMGFEPPLASPLGEMDPAVLQDVGLALADRWAKSAHGPHENGDHA